MGLGGGLFAGWAVVGIWLSLVCGCSVGLCFTAFVVLVWVLGCADFGFWLVLLWFDTAVSRF